MELAGKKWSIRKFKVRDQEENRIYLCRIDGLEYIRLMELYDLETGRIDTIDNIYHLQQREQIHGDI